MNLRHDRAATEQFREVRPRRNVIGVGGEGKVGRLARPATFSDDVQSLNRGARQAVSGRLRKLNVRQDELRRRFVMWLRGVGVCRPESFGSGLSGRAAESVAQAMETACPRGRRSHVKRYSHRVARGKYPNQGLGTKIHP